MSKRLSAGRVRGPQGSPTHAAPEPQPAERFNPGPERLHWRATTNPYGITLSRVWTEWAAKQGVSETIAAALYLLSENRKAEEVLVKLTPGEMERMIAFVQRWPDHFPPGALVALKCTSERLASPKASIRLT